MSDPFWMWPSLVSIQNFPGIVPILIFFSVSPPFQKKVSLLITRDMKIFLREFYSPLLRKGRNHLGVGGSAKKSLMLLILKIATVDGILFFLKIAWDFVVAPYILNLYIFLEPHK